MDSDRSIRLGPYETLAELASGGMGTVYLAHHAGAAGFERLVVIKRVHRHLLKSREFCDMFRDEARLASLIRHPNVVSVDDVQQAAGELFLVQPYVESLTLAELIDAAASMDRSPDPLRGPSMDRSPDPLRGPSMDRSPDPLRGPSMDRSPDPLRGPSKSERIPPAIAVRIIGDALAGLEGAHEAKDLRGQPLDIVHRDVSPDNVLVGTDGRSRLIDFGVAKARRRLTVTDSGVLKGKLAYMAPEQFRHEEVDRRTDVFAAGVVLYEALTGKRPFYGSDDGDTLLAILIAEPPPPSEVVEGISKELDTVVFKAIERDRDLRFETAGAFQEALEKALPPAPPREVAAWIERIAGDELRSRREGIHKVLEGRGHLTPTARPAESATSDARPAATPSRADLEADAPIRTIPGVARRRAALPAIAIGVAVAAIAAFAFALSRSHSNELPPAKPDSNASATAPPAPTAPMVAPAIATPAPAETAAPPTPETAAPPAPATEKGKSARGPVRVHSAHPKAGNELQKNPYGVTP